MLPRRARPLAAPPAPPALTVRHLPAEGTVSGRIDVVTRWSTTLLPAGVQVVVARRVGGGQWQLVAGPTRSTQLTHRLFRNVSVQYAVTATRQGTSCRTVSYGPVFVPRVVEDDSAAVKYRGRWLREDNAAFTARHTAYATASPSTATLRFTGIAAAVVTTQRPVATVRVSYGPGAGSDRTIANTGPASAREIVASKAYANNSAHAVTVTRLKGRVDVDAFVILAQR